MCTRIPCLVCVSDLCAIGLAAVPLPPHATDPGLPPLAVDPIMAALYERHRIEVLASIWPQSPNCVLRVSAQVYNHEAQFRTLAAALRDLLRESV